MGLKINWRGEFDGDDEYLTDLFIKRNEVLVEYQRKIKKIKSRGFICNQEKSI